MLFIWFNYVQNNKSVVPEVPREEISEDVCRRKDVICDGVHLVGQNISPGIYKTDTEGKVCYFAHLKDTSGKWESILANNSFTGSGVIVITEEYGAFKAIECGMWTKIS
jgi:hypothetical protein